MVDKEALSELVACLVPGDSSPEYTSAMADQLWAACVQAETGGGPAPLSPSGNPDSPGGRPDAPGGGGGTGSPLLLRRATAIDPDDVGVITTAAFVSAAQRPDFTFIRDHVRMHLTPPAETAETARQLHAAAQWIGALARRSWAVAREALLDYCTTQQRLVMMVRRPHPYHCHGHDSVRCMATHARTLRRRPVSTKRVVAAAMLLLALTASLRVAGSSVHRTPILTTHRTVFSC